MLADTFNGKQMFFFSATYTYLTYYISRFQGLRTTDAVPVGGEDPQMLRPAKG
jgi:hypothetical protein